MTRSTASPVLALGGLGLVLLLAGCRSDPISVPLAQPGTSGAQRQGLSLTADGVSCAASVGQHVCTLDVWYANSSDSDVTVDATKLLVRDSDGTYHAGNVDASAAQLSVPARGRTKVPWSVVLLGTAVPEGVVWTSGDGTMVDVAVTEAASPAAGTESATSTPTPTQTPTEAPTPTQTPTASTSPTATPTPTPTPKPTPTTSKPRPSASPTSTAPVGSIG